MNSNRGYRKANLPENAKRVFEGEIFDVYQWKQELYNGSTQIFEKLVRPDTAVVYPVLEDRTILLVEDTQPLQGTILCPPMGRVERNENPQEAVKRELLEETGYQAETLELLYEVEPAVKIDWKVYCYIGKGCKKTAEPKPDAGEKILPHPVTFEELIELAIRPGFDDGRLALSAFEAQLDAKKMEELRRKFLG